MKYMVSQKYYDNGKVRVMPVLSINNDNLQSSYQNKTSHDLYIDVFDTEEEAKQFYKKSLKAKKAMDGKSCE